jgi:hypothetical protein
MDTDSIAHFMISLDRYDPALEEAVANADAAVIEECHGDVFCIVDSIALGPEATEAYLEDPALDHTVSQTASTDIEIVLQGEFPLSVGSRQLS